MRSANYHRALGKLSGFPECCVEYFLIHNDLNDYREQREWKHNLRFMRHVPCPAHYDEYIKPNGFNGHFYYVCTSSTCIHPILNKPGIWMQFENNICNLCSSTMRRKAIDE